MADNLCKEFKCPIYIEIPVITISLYVIVVSSHIRTIRFTQESRLYTVTFIDSSSYVQDHLMDVLQPGLPEHTFRDGEILLRQGDTGTHLMYILSGEVEVLVKLPPIRDARWDLWSLPISEYGQKFDKTFAKLELVGSDKIIADYNQYADRTHWELRLRNPPVLTRLQHELHLVLPSYKSSCPRCTTSFSWTYVYV